MKSPDFSVPKIEHVDPANPGSLSQDRLLPWQTGIKESTHEQLGGLIKSSEDMAKEGVQTASDAANTLFNQNVPQASQALASRAKRSFAINTAANASDLGLGGVQRQQRQVQRLKTSMANVERMKKLNYQGQLRFADQIADYNDNLERAKYNTLNTITTGAGNFYGGAMGMGGMGSAVGKGGGGSQASGSPMSNLETGILN